MTLTRSFVEGRLRFTFSRVWLVRKYDNHTFYKGLSGIGLKGVDFIAVKRDKLVLIEVKNYRHVRNGHRRRSVAEALGNPQRIGGKIAQKANDTFQAMEAIRTYYERRWSYRLTYPLLRNVWWQWSDHSFWSHVTRLARQPNAVVFLIWMVTDPEDQGIMRKLPRIIDSYLDHHIPNILVTDELQEPIQGLEVKWASK